MPRRGNDGAADHAILPPNIGMSHQFGAVRLAMQFPHLGVLQATNIAVTSQVGHAVKSVVVANAGTAGKLDANDTITITFLQPVDQTAGNIPVSTNRTNTTASTSGDVICVVATAPTTIWIGRTSYATSCAQTETVTVGSITGVTQTQNAVFNASYAWTPASCTTACTGLVATVRGLMGGTAPTATTLSSASFTPTTAANKLKSVSGAVAICTSVNTATSTCRPAVTGSF